MNYINNWIYRLDGALAVDATALPVPEAAISRLGLAVGVEYLVALTSALVEPDGGEFEIVRIVGGSGGSYTLERGLEGTTAVEWPADTVIHATVTAGILATLSADSGWVEIETVPSNTRAVYARKIGSVVYMRGGMNLSPAESFVDQPVGQLPAGFEPAQELTLFSTTVAGYESCQITTAGQIIYNFPTFNSGFEGTGSLEFDGWSFPVG